MGGAASSPQNSNRTEDSAPATAKSALDNAKPSKRAGSWKRTSLREDEAGTNFSKKEFAFGRCYGRGAFGKVVAVKRKSCKTWYAAKVLDKKLGAKVQEDLKHITTEVNILVKLQSKFTANLHGGFIDKDSMYLVIDLLKAGSLDDQLKVMPDLTEAMARFYTSNVLAGLEHIHEHNIIHRDLKPDNILMCDKGYLKIVDFGASYLGTEKSKSCNFRSGTIPYMAPEMFCKNPRHNFTVDIYATGVLLFELLYKKVPYERGLKNAAPVVEKAKRDKEAEAPVGYAVKFENLASTTAKPTPECQDLIHRMMDIRSWKRIGATDGIKEVFEHSFFEDYDLGSVLDQTMVAPYVPDINGGAVNNQHEDCLDLFGSEKEEDVPLTEAQLATYEKLAETLANFNDKNANAMQ
jgi:serine/threonine protein kinase